MKKQGDLFLKLPDFALYWKHVKLPNVLKIESLMWLKLIKNEFKCESISYSEFDSSSHREILNCETMSMSFSTTSSQFLGSVLFLNRPAMSYGVCKMWILPNF